MVLTVEITDIKVKDAGEKFAGKMHNVSAKMILKKEGVSVLERTFTANHKDIYSGKGTMAKIRICMNAVKKTYEAECALKAELEKEIPAMLVELNKEV